MLSRDEIEHAVEHCSWPTDLEDGAKDYDQQILDTDAALRKELFEANIRNGDLKVLVKIAEAKPNKCHLRKLVKELQEKDERVKELEDAIYGDPYMPAMLRPIEWTDSLVKEFEREVDMDNYEDPPAGMDMLSEVKAMIEKLRTLREPTK